MLDPSGRFVRLPGEEIVWKSPLRTSLAIKSPQAYPGNDPLSIHSNAGLLYLTNQRVSLSKALSTNIKEDGRLSTSQLLQRQVWNHFQLRSSIFTILTWLFLGSEQTAGTRSFNLFLAETYP